MALCPLGNDIRFYNSAGRAPTPGPMWSFVKKFHERPNIRAPTRVAREERRKKEPKKRRR